MHTADLAQRISDLWERLDRAQRTRVSGVANELEAQFPAPFERDTLTTVLRSAAEYVLGDLTPEDQGRRLQAARNAADVQLKASRQVALLALEDGASDSGTARALGVTRTAIQEWAGKIKRTQERRRK